MEHVISKPRPEETSMAVPRKTEPVVLKLWIFKLTSDDFGVSVEGYRAKDEREREMFNWRSTPIVERMTSRMLKTNSGTIYVLRGPIDDESLIALGYPYALVKQFEQGFPPNWQRVLRSMHSSFSRSLLNSSQWLNSVLTSWKDTTRTARLSCVTDRAAAELKQASVDRVKEQREHKENHACVEKTKPIPSASSQEEISLQAVDILQPPLSAAIRLHNWTILFSVKDRGVSKLFDKCGIVIEGFRKDLNTDWKTSCIVAVDDSHHVRTSASVYKLRGPMNTLVASQQGYPKEFVANFLCGFPSAWHTILANFFTANIEPYLPQLEDGEEEPEETNSYDTGEDVESIVSSSSFREVAETTSDQENMMHNHRAVQMPKLPKSSNKPHKKAQKRRVSFADEGKKARASVPSKKSKPPNSAEDGMVRMSRSGRVLTRPLRSWAGERIAYDVYGEPIEVAGFSPSTGTDPVHNAQLDAVAQHMGLVVSRKTEQPESRSSTNEQRRAARSASSDSDDYEPPTPLPGRRKKKARHVLHSSSEDEMGASGSRKSTKKKKHKKVVALKRDASKNGTKQQAKAKKTVKREKQQVIESEVDDSSMSDDEGSVPMTDFGDSDDESDTDMQLVPRRWKRDEIERLKVVVRAIKPNEQADWEAVAQSLDRSAEECQIEAEKRLGWKAHRRLTQVAQERDLQQLACAAGKAKVGTVSYQVKAQRFTRKYLMAGGQSDFFEETLTNNAVNAMPSVVEFSTDDSLLAVLKTPGPNEVRRANHRQFIPLPAQRTPASTDPSTSAIYNLNSVQRDQRERYAHELLKRKGMNSMNASSLNLSKACAPRQFALKMPPMPNMVSEPDEDAYFSSDSD